MDTTAKPAARFRGLRTLLSHVEPASMCEIRKRALHILASLGADVRERLVAQLRLGQSVDDIETNLALAYADLLLCGREPMPSVPARDDRPVEPRELLTEACVAAVDGDLTTYRRALHDLTALADRGWMLSSADLETAR